MNLNMKFRVTDQILEGALSKWIQCTEQSIKKIKGRPLDTLGIIASPDENFAYKEAYEKYQLDFYYSTSTLPDFFIDPNTSEEEVIKKQLLKDSLVEFFELQGFTKVWLSTSVDCYGDSCLFLGLREDE